MRRHVSQKMIELMDTFSPYMGDVDKYPYKQFKEGVPIEAVK